MKLKDFQQQIFNYLNRTETDSNKLKFVLESKGIDRRTRLDSYLDSFENRTIEVIKEDFEITGLFLKEKSFYEYINKFLKCFPPKTHYINEIGRQFAGYMEKNLNKDSEDFVVELAKLEWLMVECFYNYFNSKDNTKKVKPAKGQTPISKNKSLILIKSPWPLARIWNEEKKYGKKDSYNSVWTLEDRIVRIKEWSELEYKILEILSSSNTLEQAVDLAEDYSSTEKLSEVFSLTLPIWIENGILVVG